MTRSKVKVTRCLQLEILQFSKSFSSGIFNVSWQMTTDSETREQYLNFVQTRFLISVLFFVSRDYELGIKFRLPVVYLLVEVSAFGNFSTDTGNDFGGVDRQSRTWLIFIITVTSVKVCSLCDCDV